MGFDNLTAAWNRVRDSLWFVPATLTLGAIVLALVTIQIDAAGLLPRAPAGIWLFSGTAPGARGVLTAIASGFITVTGVVFSITIVALQLASTQFTPRILRNFTSDPVNQLVLGVFIATFTYALLVVRVVRGPQDGVTAEQVREGLAATPRGPVEGFVPNLSVTVALGLAVISIGFLIYFIDHAARSIRASVIIDRVTSDAMRIVERRFPETVGEPTESMDGVVPDSPGYVIVSERSGYVQGVDEDALLKLLGEGATVIRMEPEIGSYLLPGAGLATVWPAGAGSDEGVADGVRKAFVLGHERTPHLALELGITELADMAVKALSPGINDPTTAILCVDRIAEILLAAGRREPPGRVRRPAGDGGTLLLPLTRFESLVNTAFDEIRHYGVENPRFALTFLERLGDLGLLLPPHRRPPVARHAAALLRTAGKAVMDESDLQRVEAAGARALRDLGIGEA